jgi:cardiolipin synthase
MNRVNNEIDYQEHFSEKLYFNGDSFYESIFKKFRAAKKSVYIEAHYLDDNRLGQTFYLNLCEVLDRGVAVFMVVDGFSPQSKKLVHWFNELERKGAHISFFHPLPWRQFSIRGIFRLNQRSHKKVVIVDKKTAYLGSFNIDTRQMSRTYGGENWHDIGIKVKGKSRIKHILNGFYDTWSYTKNIKKNKESELNLHSTIRLNHSRSLRKQYFNDLVKKIYDAKERIWITNPYFVPDHKMIRALEHAFRNGIDVKIIIPEKSDLKLFPLINSLFYRELIKKGVCVYEYTPDILHSKVMIIDNWFMIGSSNLNSRTQKHDWEIDIILQKPKSHHELERRFVKDLYHSKKVTLGIIGERFGGKEYTFPFLRAAKYFL